MPIWNPLPYFDTVHQDHQLGNIQSIDRFYDAAKKGKLPAVSWIASSVAVSEHFPGKISDGVAFVTSLINAVMHGPDWDSTAVFLAWDDWGGMYDHVAPPSVEANGYGLRVPTMLLLADPTKNSDHRRREHRHADQPAHRGPRYAALPGSEGNSGAGIEDAADLQHVHRPTPRFVV